MHTMTHITEADAIDAVLAAAYTDANGARVVAAALGDLPVPMTVTAAVKLVRGAFDNARAELALVGWAGDLDATDGLGLVILDAGGAVTRLAARRTADVLTIEQPGPAVRPHLRVVPAERPAAG